MTIHHLNCGTMCPMGRLFMNGEGSPFERGIMVCHCLLIETPDGLVAVDTGLGMDDVKYMEQRFPTWFRVTGAPRRDAEETLLMQVKRLGYQPSDVRDIVVTHLDLDHAGGLPDFPHAKVHVYGLEHDVAVRRSTMVEKHRYVSAQWEHGPHWQLYKTEGDRWFGFSSVRALSRKNTDILLIPLLGHTRGHCGVAIKTDAGWLLHAGDAYFFHGEMDLQRPRCPPGLVMFQKALAMDEGARVTNQARLRNLLREHGDEVTMHCSHSPVELARFTERPALVS